jgi:hypothetical protein
MHNPVPVPGMGPCFGTGAVRITWFFLRQNFKFKCLLKGQCHEIGVKMSPWRCN